MLLGSESSGRWLGHKDGVLINGICALIKNASQKSLIYSTMWGHTEKLAVCNLEEDFHQDPAMLAPWPWTSILQNCDKYIYVVYKLASLW